MRSFPFFRQYDTMDCGPACLKMVAAWYGREHPIELLRQKCYITKGGVSLLSLSEAAEKTGFHTTGVKISFDQLISNCPLPCIVHWEQEHFVVLYKIKKTGGLFKKKV